MTGISLPVNVEKEPCVLKKTSTFSRVSGVKKTNRKHQKTDFRKSSKS
jgi:hypothetical protein